MTLEVAYLAPGRMSTAERQDEYIGEDSVKKDRNYYFPGIYLSS